MAEIAINLWWDRGILWISIAEGTIALNSYEALALLKRLEEEKPVIDAQVVIDKSEGL